MSARQYLCVVCVFTIGVVFGNATKSERVISRSHLERLSGEISIYPCDSPGCAEDYLPYRVSDSSGETYQSNPPYGKSATYRIDLSGGQTVIYCTKKSTQLP